MTHRLANATIFAKGSSQATLRAPSEDTLKNFCSSAAILLASAVGLSATTLTTTLPTVNETTIAGTLVLPQFNAALGTLTGVTLNLGLGTLQANTSISDFEGTGGVINITYDLGYAVTFALPVVGNYVAQDFQPLNCSGSGAEISSCSNSLALSLSNLGGSFDLSPDAAAFLSGPVNVPYTPSSIQTLVGTSVPTNPSNLQTSVTGVSLTMPGSITYTYTPASLSTPEPAPLALFAVGLFGIFGFAKLRMRRRA